MRLLVDECCEASLARMLREAGHDVLYGAEMMASVGDPLVLARARAERRVLVTADKDFGRLALFAGAPDEGVILLRLPEREREQRLARVAELLADPARLKGQLVVVGSQRVRFRPLPGRERS